jgi:hypothetical protein
MISKTSQYIYCIGDRIATNYFYEYNIEFFCIVSVEILYLHNKHLNFYRTLFDLFRWLEPARRSSPPRPPG